MEILRYFFYFWFFLIILAFRKIHKDILFPGFWALLPVIGAALIIIGGEGIFNKKILANKSLVWIGLISYPLYLWHYPILSFLKIVTPSGDLTIKARIIAVAVSFFLAYVSYRFVEKPIRFGTKFSKGKPLLLVLLLGFVGFAGYITVYNNGFMFRLPVEIQDIQHYKSLYEKSVQWDWKLHKCFLNLNNDSFSEADCIDKFSNTPLPLIFVWGDSRAAAFSVGLRRIQKDKFRLAQYTQSSCPPWIYDPPDDDNECMKKNLSILEQIKKIKPDVVLLHAEFTFQKFGGKYYYYENIPKTLQKLKSFGVQRIIVLGISPTWVNDLPKLLVDIYRKDPLSTLPNRSNIGLTKQLSDACEEILIKYAKDYDVMFISARDILRNEAGCLTKINSANDSITTFDGGHLSPIAAEFVAKQVIGGIL